MGLAGSFDLDSLRNPVRGSVVLAFDDGRASTMLAHSVLKPAGIVATLPLIPGWLGSAEYMTWDDVDTVVSDGWEITNHTLTHPTLTDLTTVQIDAEVAQARDAIAARKYPTDGHLDFVAPRHASSPTVRKIAMRYSRTCRDTSWSKAMPVGFKAGAIWCHLFQPTDLATTFALFEQAIRSGQVLFLNTHGGDTAKWGQVRDWIVNRGYEDRFVTMTGLLSRYASLR